VKSDTTGLAKQ